MTRIRFYNHGIYNVVQESLVEVNSIATSNHTQWPYLQTDQISKKEYFIQIRKIC